MPVIHLETFIEAKPEKVFDLARSIDMHVISTQGTDEKVVGGRSSGLIELGESVTWQARHLGVVQRLTSKITAFDYPQYFVDEMQQGIFKSFRHEHLFLPQTGGTLMTDVFTYVSPLGLLGKLADKLFLYGYLKRLLIKRNAVIKAHAENSIF
ncbi:SRPBCC family protein [Pedobacter nutrimenti]|jgi:ligand-binding SRPBCC domain-containing protein|uniref:Ligand-binding SRPBCC domain-containing protein n=1 Tax=Pedobacter nutrimenti TaxID=1241337 RepID=A0A318UIS1_9SPHI|nr:SRPBCC family protein [Pedobacter nutrimenti]PYF74968.1 ligand-binding SRPBCC domain-containing protein [Pedobacter nutrimenti]